MTERLTGLIEDLTGRKVLAYQSQVLFEPDRVIEMFVFDDDARPEHIRATAEGLLGEQSVGDVHPGDEGLDAPSQQGQ